MTLTHPPIDPELAAALEAVRDQMPTSVTDEMIPALQESSRTTDEAVAELEVRFGVVLETEQVTSELDVIVARAANRPRQGSAPIVFFVHGGGMILGDAYFGLDHVLPWVESTGALVVSPNYRLAPQHPDPAPADDCWEALRWVAAHARELGGDARRIMVVGHSAGAGLAAGLALRARDHGGPVLRGQLLMCPMLDDRSQTPSSQELLGEGVWDRIANQTAWRALLGGRSGGAGVSTYAAPGRALDLAGVAPAYVDVGSVDTFRDEAVRFASAIWRDRGEAELHVWPGAYHCFEIVAPEAAVSQQARRARAAWAESRLKS